MSESILYHFNDWQPRHEARGSHNNHKYTVAFGHDPHRGYWVSVTAEDRNFSSLMTQSTPEHVIKVLRSYNVQFVAFNNEFPARVSPQRLNSQDRWKVDLANESRNLEQKNR